MNYAEIRRLVRLVERSKISELEIEEEGYRVRILKQSTVDGAIPQISCPSVAQSSTRDVTPEEVASIPAVTTPESEPHSNSIEVTSPMVGTFYRAPSPEAPSYVQVGDFVRMGQVLCIIEAMKLMNEIEAEYSGRIIEIAVENAQPVEFGQRLFRIESE